MSEGGESSIEVSLFPSRHFDTSAWLTVHMIDKNPKTVFQLDSPFTSVQWYIIPSYPLELPETDISQASNIFSESRDHLGTSAHVRDLSSVLSDLEIPGFHELGFDDYT